jgi:hypothetical protein
MDSTSLYYPAHLIRHDLIFKLYLQNVQVTVFLIRPRDITLLL